MCEMPDSRASRRYKKSTRSGGSGGNCVEWAFEGGRVYIRDSKNPDGPELLATFTEWAAFTAAVDAGDPHPWIQRRPTGVHVARDGRQLRFTATEWAAFVAGVHAGECEPEPAAA
jgi:hypothetical protein